MAYQADRPGAKTHLDQAKKIAKGIYRSNVPRRRIGGADHRRRPSERERIGSFAFQDWLLSDRAKDAVVWSASPMAGQTWPGPKLALEVGREETKEQNKNLYILTDGTRSAGEPQVQTLKQLGPDWLRTFKVTHYNLSEGKQQWNEAVLDVAPTGGLVRTKFDSDFKADVKCFGPPQQATVQWKVDDQPLANSTPVMLGPDSPDLNTREHRPQFTAGGPHSDHGGSKRGGRPPPDRQRSLSCRRRSGGHAGAVGRRKSAARVSREFRQLAPGGPHARTRSADQDAQQLYHRANQRH